MEPSWESDSKPSMSSRVSVAPPAPSVQGGCTEPVDDEANAGRYTEAATSPVTVSMKSTVTGSAVARVSVDACWPREGAATRTTATIGRPSAANRAARFTGVGAGVTVAAAVCVADGVRVPVGVWVGGGELDRDGVGVDDGCALWDGVAAGVCVLDGAECSPRARAKSRPGRETARKNREEGWRQ